MAETVYTHPLNIKYRKQILPGLKRLFQNNVTAKEE
jgi:hypothetical protein